MTPQARQVLDHLTHHGPLTGVEAETVYKIRHLPRRIADLRELGEPIESITKRDALGQRYVSYRLRAPGVPSQLAFTKETV